MSIQKYINLGKYARHYDHSKTLKEIKDYFRWLYNKNDMDYIGLMLQITIKKSRPMYLHGYMISSALHNYIMLNNNITILETGTARGFSALIMAKVLNNNNINGIIHTIDLISHNEKNFNNNILAAQKKRAVSRKECLEKWINIVNKYIKFHTGDSENILKNLNLKRINFAFLDGAHYYDDVKKELKYVKDRQISGDIIVCDDYTKKQFPGICKAIDEFIKEGLYNLKIIYGNDGTKNRGYVYMIKI